jgi:hypothetical protein
MRKVALTSSLVSRKWICRHQSIVPSLPSWRTVKSVVMPQHNMETPPLVLWAAAENPSDWLSLAWRSVDDRTYGGKSTASISMHEEVGEPFMRFSGGVVFNKEIARATNTVGGFCAIRAEMKQVVDLSDHVGIEIMLRCRHSLKFRVNLGKESYMASDIYQMHLETEGKEDWTRVRLPFHRFA